MSGRNESESVDDFRRNQHQPFGAGRKHHLDRSLPGTDCLSAIMTQAYTHDEVRDLARLANKVTTPDSSADLRPQLERRMT